MARAVAAALACGGERCPAPLSACEAACVPRQPGVDRDAALGQVRGDRLRDGAAARAAGCADGVGDDAQPLRGMPSVPSSRSSWRRPWRSCVSRAPSTSSTASARDQRFTVQSARRRGRLRGRLPRRRRSAGTAMASACRARVIAPGRASSMQRLRVGWAEQHRRPAGGFGQPALHELALHTTVAAADGPDESRGVSPASRRRRAARRGRRRARLSRRAPWANGGRRARRATRRTRSRRERPWRRPRPGCCRRPLDARDVPARAPGSRAAASLTVPRTTVSKLVARDGRVDRLIDAQHRRGLRARARPVRGRRDARPTRARARNARR